MAAERFNAFEKVLTDLGARVAYMEDNIKDTFGKHDTQINTLQEAHTTLTIQLDQFSKGLAAQKTKLVEDIDDEFAKHRVAIEAVIDGAKEQFRNTKANLDDLYGQSSVAFIGVRAAIDEIRKDVERNRGEGGQGTGGFKGFLNTKQMLPDKFGKAEEVWRRWQDNVADYTNAITRGMR